MPAVDFRTQNFDIANITRSGKFLGRRYYWRLHLIENAMRILLNTVLTTQLQTKDWFLIVADDTIRGKVNYVKNDYSSYPAHNSPGGHEIYYLFLPDLTKILTLNSHHFVTLIPAIDGWIAQLESIRLPRNLVGHMNWPNAHDLVLIEQTYLDIKRLIRHLQRAGVIMQVPT